MRHLERLTLVAVLPAVLLLAEACSSGPSGPRRFEGPGPVELHVAIAASDSAALEKVFFENFYPAVSSQPGFRHCNLLKVPNREGSYVLTIAFESEDLRLRWVATDLHQEVWGMMTQSMQGGKPSSIEALGITTRPAE
jgi:heme-degrading monooxygenase HmoA